MWPEARGHSVCFTYRHLACWLCLWFRERRDCPDIWFVAIVFANLLAVDTVTYLVKHHSSAIRDSTGDKAHKFLESSMQFITTTAAMHGSPRVTQRIFVFIIQNN